MIRACAIWIVASMALGCQSGKEPVRGARTGFEAPVSYPRPEPAEPTQPISRFPPDPPESRVVANVEASDELPQRDLGAELKAALGSPIDCVRDFAPSVPMTIRINVTGIVRPTGMIIEPSAYGSGLSKRALDCVRQRVGRVMLKPLDDTVSSTASTVFEIEYEPSVIVEADPGTPVPELKRVVEPMPKLPHIPLIAEGGPGVPIEDRFRGWLQGGNVKHPDGPKTKKVTGPKPRAIDGYEVDENAQEWR